MLTIRLKVAAGLVLVAALVLTGGTRVERAVAQEETKKDEKPEKDKDKDKDKDKGKPDDKKKDKDKKKVPVIPKRSARQATIVLPVKSQPDADTIAALEKVFGKDLKVSGEKELNVVVVQGPESVARAALQGLRNFTDAATIKRASAWLAESKAAEQDIELIKLKKADPSAVVKVIKKYVSGTLEVTEKSKARAVLIEGDREAVSKAVSLARQLDGGQHLDYGVYQLMHEIGKRKE
jgi:hypothetical protein